MRGRSVNEKKDDCYNENMNFVCIQNHETKGEYMKKGLLMIVVLAMLALVSTAVFADDEVWHLGILVHSLDNEFWAQEAKGGELFADSKDDVVAQVLATDGDDNKEMQAMRDFIAQYGDHSIFVTDPASKANTANVVEIAEEAGAKVAILWHHADELEPAEWDSFVVHMSPDDYVAGYNTAKHLFELMGGKGKVVALYGQQGEDSAANRYAGFLGALEEYPEIECLDMQVASWSQDQAMTFTQTWLSTYDDIDAIWAANDTMGLGAIEALKLEGKNGQILVCGCDGIAAAYEAIEAGDMACTVANNGYLLMGYGASYAYQAAKNGLVLENPVVKTQAVLVTADNVAEYKAMFIDGTPEYDFDDLSFCVLSEHPSFAELAAASEEEEEPSWDAVMAQLDTAIEEGIANGEEGAVEAKQLVDLLKGIYEGLTAEEAK